MVKEAKEPKFNYGGQAVIEGVMMRGSKVAAVAVRDPEGNIVIHTEPLDQRIYGSKLIKIPFLRGLTMLWDALGLGMKSILFSAEVALEEESGVLEEGETPHSIFEKPSDVGAILLSLTLAIGLFFVLPTVLSTFIEQWLNVQDNLLLANMIEGVIRLTILVGYVWAIGLIPDIRRLYGYHGAEHKTINAYEAEAPLTPEEVAKFPIEHPRCGTAFLLTVVLVSILLYTVLPEMGLAVRIVSRLLLIPVIAGIAYEILKWTAANQHNPLVRLMIKPNLALQHLTTKEPDLEMIEVAIQALEKVLAFENDLKAQPAKQTITVES